MTSPALRHPQLLATAAQSRAVEEAFLRLERWGSARHWEGTDPYDGLNATRFAGLFRHTALGRRGLTQAVKRSPLDLRPLFGIPPACSAMATALIASAYAAQRLLPEEDSRRKLETMVDLLLAQRLGSSDEPCWGYHFDVQTRVFFYPKGSPNTIASAFAGFALLDAYARTGKRELLALAQGTAEFFVNHVPQTSAKVGAFFGYLPGDRTPIHNSNLLAATLLARVAHEIASKDLRERAQRAVNYTVSHQRPDGSWPYGEVRGLDWTDNFHTAYVLTCLEYCRRAGLQGCEDALEAGLAYYLRAFFDRAGAPKYYPDSLYPVDSQCAAEGIRTFALIADQHPSYREPALRAFLYAENKLLGPDGAYVFQRRRLWTNRQAHIRWVQAPFMLALAVLSSLLRS